jgi:hypothetical protein
MTGMEEQGSVGLDKYLNSAEAKAYFKGVNYATIVSIFSPAIVCFNRD